MVTNNTDIKVVFNLWKWDTGEIWKTNLNACRTVLAAFLFH